MKRIFFALICLMFSLTGSAQPKSLGVRAGLEYQLSYEHRVTTHGDFIEMDLGYQLLGNGLNVACAYDFMVARPKWTRRGEWGFYIGPAVKVGHLWVGTYISAGAQIGLEYNFDFPLQISLDIRPAVGVGIVNRSASLYGGESVIGACPALSLRYCFL